MKVRSKSICLICAVVALGACGQITFFQHNTHTATPGPISLSRLSAVDAQPGFSTNYLEEMEYRLEQFSSRFCENMSLPHRPPVR